MADNSASSGGSGDSIRTVNKTVNSAVKTQMQIIDIGGGTDASPEIAWTGGVNVYDGTGNVINSVSAGTGLNGLLTSAGATAFFYSTNNASTTQLAPTATFTGTLESAQSQPAISLCFSCDQNSTVTVLQYVDVGGTQLIDSWAYYVLANKGLNISAVLNGNYIRITVVNNGTATTTTLNLNVAYGQIARADQAGNEPVAIMGTGDLAGINLLEECIKGELPLTVTVTNTPAVDINAANAGVVPTDCQGWVLKAGIPLVLDTVGYNSAYVQSYAGIVTVTQSNSLTTSTFMAIPNGQQSGGSIPGNTTASGGGLTLPVGPRYMMFSLPAGATNNGSVYLRSAQMQPMNTAQGSPVNILGLSGYALGNASAPYLWVSGNNAENQANSSNPVMNGGISRTVAAAIASAAGNVVRDTMTTGGAKVVYPYAVPDVSQRYTAGTAGLAVNTSTQAFAAGAAGIRNYVTDIHVTNTVATAQSIAVLDGATVIWAGTLGSTVGASLIIQFATPLRGTAATSLNVQLTAATATLINLTGFQAP